jgi:hypothetical protein
MTRSLENKDENFSTKKECFVIQFHLLQLDYDLRTIQKLYSIESVSLLPRPFSQLVTQARPITGDIVP